MNSKSGVNISGLHTFCTYTYNYSTKEDSKKTEDFKEIGTKGGQN